MVSSQLSLPLSKALQRCPDPYGIDADASIAIGLLRKILMIVILRYFQGSFTHFVRELGISQHLNFIRIHATWYQVNQTWDPRTTLNKKKQSRFSKIRQAIVTVYNTMSFPRHFMDLRKDLIKLGYDLHPTRIMMYLNQLGVYASKISRCLNPTKTETCIARTTRAVGRKRELNQLQQSHTMTQQISRQIGIIMTSHH